jgi:hypothetical protein
MGKEFHTPIKSTKWIQKTVFLSNIYDELLLCSATDKIK